MNPTTISKVVALIVAGGPTAMDLFLALEPSLGLDVDTKRAMANSIASTDGIDPTVLAKLEAWMGANGMKQRSTISFVK